MALAVLGGERISFPSFPHSVPTHPLPALPCSHSQQNHGIPEMASTANSNDEVASSPLLSTPSPNHFSLYIYIKKDDILFFSVMLQKLKTHLQPGRQPAFSSFRRCDWRRFLLQRVLGA